MNNDFRRAHEGFVATWEGGYVNHKNDRGGETNLGVTASVWRSWCAAQGLPVKPMRDLTMADVLPLYEARYWNPLAASLPWPLSAAIYDMSVNHGTGTVARDNGATRLLRLARQAKPGGTPLEQALAACDAREAFFRAIVAHDPTQGVFLKGWLRRVNGLRAWLWDNAAPATRVFLTDPNGKRALWNGQPTNYGGKELDAAFITRLQGLYPRGTTGVRHGDLTVTVAEDGAIILARA